MNTGMYLNMEGDQSASWELAVCLKLRFENLDNLCLNAQTSELITTNTNINHYKSKYKYKCKYKYICIHITWQDDSIV